MTGKLTHFIAGEPGYFRTGAEDNFPWDRTDKGVWYALFVVENGKLVHYGFTASKSNKAGLRQALESLEEADESLLIGVWMGQWSTHLFILNPMTAIKKLAGTT
jgi:hypothetical protein